MKKLLVIFCLCLFCILTLTSSAQNKCTPQTIKGTYSVTCTGFVPPPGPPVEPPVLVPYAGQGTVITDVVEGKNTIVGGADLSIAGFHVAGPVAAQVGDVDMRPDCTGSIVYNRGTEFQLNVNFIALEQGKELRGFIMNPGYAVTCNLRLMSRDTTPN